MVHRKKKKTRGYNSFSSFLPGLHCYGTVSSEDCFPKRLSLRSKQKDTAEHLFLPSVFVLSRCICCQSRLLP